MIRWAEKNEYTKVMIEKIRSRLLFVAEIIVRRTNAAIETMKLRMITTLSLLNKTCTGQPGNASQAHHGEYGSRTMAINGA